VRVVPLGGLEEVGRNMMFIEYGEDIIIIDMGLQFPEESMPGIDFIIPNTTYLEEHKDRIRGVVITHAHMDHIGAISYLVHRLGNPPIFAMPLTRGIILKRHDDFPHLPKLNLQELKTDQELDLGVFHLEFFHVNHNIFDTVGVAIYTPAGIVCHTADFKFDNNPVGDKPADYAKMAELSRKGVLLLMSDSTNAKDPGHSISEQTIMENLEDIFEHAKGRIITATFASLISRVQQLIWLAEKFGRKVAIDGYSMRTIVAIARELGYIKVQKDTFIEMKDAHRYPSNRLLFIVTGAQGEARAALMRIIQREHRFVRLQKGDTVVFSSSAIPGNERSIQNMQDVIYRQGARVFHYQMMDIHAGGHAKAEDLKLMINLMRPKFFMPIHGNYFMLRIHGDLAESVGIPPENIVIPSNGGVVELTPESVTIAKETVPATYVFVDGLGIGDVKEVVLRDRQAMASDGMFVIVALVDAKTGKVKNSPDIISRGFIYLKESQKLLYEARGVTRRIIEEMTAQMHPINIQYIREALRDKLGLFLFQKTSRRPMVLPVVIEI
jgi:ribonuclease J